MIAFTVLAAEAAVYSPRVLSPHVADTYSMKTFAQFHRWRDLEAIKVYAIFKYLMDEQTGIGTALTMLAP